jgi:hypothetical protein
MKKLQLAYFLGFILAFNISCSKNVYRHPTLGKLKIYPISDNLDSINKELRRGNKNAIKIIYPYLGNETEIIDLLGHHILRIKEKDKAYRILKENFYLPQFPILQSDSLNKQDFKLFSEQNWDKIYFNKDLEAYQIHPISKQNLSIEFRELTETRNENIENLFNEIKNEDWFKKGNYYLLIKDKNPIVLKKIAEEFYRKRDRFNEYNFKENQYYSLLNQLIGLDFSNLGNKEIRVWEASSYHFNENSLNEILVYFSTNFHDFSWDDMLGHFVNPKLKYTSSNKLLTEFENLFSQQDSIAINSFLKLTQTETKDFLFYFSEFEQKDKYKVNYSLPLFPFRFLKQLNLLTNYCKENKIDYLGTQEIQMKIEKLKSELSFQERRKLENELIENMDLNDLTPLEYWTMVYQKSTDLQYSISRVIDIYYSKNWSKIISDENQLKLYLKKSHLFKNIGINGSLNNYLAKFMGNGEYGINHLTKIKTEDSDIETQINKAIELCQKKFIYPIDDNKINDANFDAKRVDLKKDFNQIKSRKSSLDQDDYENEIEELFSKIYYDQISEAISLASKLKFEDFIYGPFIFLERDFGFFMVEEWNNAQERNEFLKIYNAKSERELYEYYLDLAEIDYKNSKNELDFDKIFEILKFNNIYPLTGSSRKENEVYSIIKLLEFNFKTTLGYPQKLCNSAGMYGCDPIDRVWEWMKFLEENKLVNLNSNNIASFQILKKR